MPQRSARRNRFPSPRPSPLRLARWAALLCLATLSSACPSDASTDCETACARGFVCDGGEGRCIQAELPPVGRVPSGRAARVAASGERVFVAAIDPVLRHINVGALDTHADQPGQPSRIDWRELAPLSGAVAEKRIALAASPLRVAVAWLGPDGRYELAHRPVGGPHTRWSFETVAPTAAPYRGTEFFDLAFDDRDQLHIAFQERDRTLRRLRSSAPTASEAIEAGDDAPRWLLDTIDDGKPGGEGVDCPAELRGTGTPPGVGVDPDLHLDGQDAWVAYYDGDCGDLRIARLDGERWSPAIVDTGDFEPGSGFARSRGRAGRYPSLGIGPDRRIAVAYHDVSHGRLWYAQLGEEGWRRELVDPGVELDAASRQRKQLVGAFATLSVDERGAPWITYFNATTAELRIAERAAPDQPWSHRTVAGDGVVGFFAHHAWTPQTGRTIVAERLAPGPDGLASELVVEREEP